MQIENEKIRLRLQSVDGKRRRHQASWGFIATLCVIYTMGSLVIKLLILLGIMK